MGVIDENQEHKEQDESGLSRRDILKRGAIVGGAMWAAPVVQKVRLSQSVAQGTSPIEPTPTPTEVPCQTTGPVQMAHAVIDGPDPIWRTDGQILCTCENEHISDGSVYFDAEAIGLHSYKLTMKAELDCTIVTAQSKYFDDNKEEFACAEGVISEDGRSVVVGREELGDIYEFSVCFECCLDALPCLEYEDHYAFAVWDGKAYSWLEANTIQTPCDPCHDQGASFVVGSDHLEFNPVPGSLTNRVTIQVKGGEDCLIDAAVSASALIAGVEVPDCEAGVVANDQKSVDLGHVEGPSVEFIEVCFRCCNPIGAQ